MVGFYDPALVSLSAVIAMMASYVTFSLARRITGTTGGRSLLWLSGGALAMAAGIWSMHFIGMLAFHLPVPVSYRGWTTLLSFLIALAVSGVALFLVSRPRMGAGRLVAGGLVMGFGIAGMHFTGMSAMNLGGAIRFNPLLVGLSVLIAVAASIVALRIVFSLNQGKATHSGRKKAMSAAVMGMAIAGMHYTGMAAATFPDTVKGTHGQFFDSSLLGITIGLVAFMVLTITLILSLVDSHLANRTARLIRSLKNANEKLQYMALHDALTRLPNRALLSERVDEMIRQAGMGSSGFPLLFLDLDRFKAINDSLGHHVGDKLLVLVGERLLQTLKPEDTVARIGGDEFVILLHDVQDSRKVLTTAKTILETISRPYVIDQQTLIISGSIGIAMYPCDGMTFRTLLVNADSAMYHVKKSGTDRIGFFSPDMNAMANLRIEQERELSRAIDQGEFLLHFQPKVTIETGRIESVEALVRWNHPVRGLLYPSEFIALAEETGLIVPLGCWVIRAACQANAAWLASGLPRLRVGVNLSARQLLEKDLATFIADALWESGLDPDCLELEITETLLMHDPEGAKRTLSEIRDRGVHIAIDDFGTGYSSLLYLKKFPLDALKIDRAFIVEIETDKNDGAIVRTIITLAHSLGLRVIAEGVETRGQMEILREMECDAFQGYFRSPPVSPEKFVELITADRLDLPSLDHTLEG